jgi:hypothetical protein
VGQHRFNKNLIVREAQPNQRTFNSLYGYFEARVKAAVSGYLCALWMIGFEEVSEESGEIAESILSSSSSTTSACTNRKAGIRCS